MSRPEPFVHVAGRNHVLVTASLAARGTVWPVSGRLSDHLRKGVRTVARVREAEVAIMTTGDVRMYRDVRLPIDQIILAHEYIELGGDPFLKRMHEPSPTLPATIVLRDLPGLLIEGSMSDAALDEPHRFLVLLGPKVVASPSGFDFARFLGPLEYLLVNRSSIEGVLTYEVTKDHP